MQKPCLSELEQDLYRAERKHNREATVKAYDLRQLLDWAAHLELAVMASAPPPRSQPSSENAMGFE